MTLITKELQEQEHCEHQWKFWYNDSHYNFYKCLKCGKESKE